MCRALHLFSPVPFAVLFLFCFVSFSSSENHYFLLASRLIMQWEQYWLRLAVVSTSYQQGIPAFVWSCLIFTLG